MKGRANGSRLYSPEQIEELRKNAIEEGKAAVKSELEGNTRDKFNQAVRRIQELERKISDEETKREQRESALTIMKDATRTLDMIVTQAVMVLQETK